MPQQETDLATWERERQEALADFMAALDAGDLDLNADPLAFLPILNRFVAEQELDAYDDEDWRYLHTILAAYIAEVLIQKYSAHWRLCHDSRGPNYMLVTTGYDGHEYEVSPMDVVYYDFKNLPPEPARMLATAELTAHVVRRYDD